MSVPSPRTRSRYTEKFPNAKMDLRPRVWRQLPAVLFWRESLATVFLVLVLPAPFLGTPSAMAKSANDITCPLNVSDLDKSTLADAIGDYFEDCSLSLRDAEGVAAISEGFLETGT